MKVHIATTSNFAVGDRCIRWAERNLPSGVELVEDMEKCEIFISVFYPKIVSSGFIAKRKRCFNFHGGVLPEYRGSAIFNWVVLNGEKETGITLHEIDARIDHGPIIETRRFPVEEKDTPVELFGKAEELLFVMFVEWFDRLIALDYVASPQDDTRAKLYLRKNFQEMKDLTKFARAFHMPPYEQAYYRNKKGEKNHLSWE